MELRGNWYRYWTTVVVAVMTTMVVVTLVMLVMLVVMVMGKSLANAGKSNREGKHQAQDQLCQIRLT